MGDATLTAAQELEACVALIEKDPEEAVPRLERLQHRVADRISKNEELADLATSALPFVALEHHIAIAMTRCMDHDRRLVRLERACALWEAFLQTCDRFELLSTEETKQLQALMEQEDSDEAPRFLSVSRDEKIARFRAKQQAEQMRSQLQALQQRRGRLQVSDDEVFDGHDLDSLERSLALQQLAIAKIDAFDEWGSTLRELPLLRHRHKNSGPTNDVRRPPPASQQKPLEVTRITQDAAGALQVRKEVIQSQVFRPGWNLPTMSLDELAAREVADAQARDERQRKSEAAQQLAPRRYDQLIKDGLDDNADLVDASAVLDRQWDDFKDENPRGSGNKRANVGDRNF